MRLIRDGEKGGGGGGMEVCVWGGGWRLYTYPLHCHHQNDSCVKMGSNESHFNVSVGSDGQSHKRVHKPQNVLKRKESRSGIETEVLPLTSLRSGCAQAAAIKIV